MKNLIFSLAFVLAGIFAFANGNIEKPISSDLEGFVETSCTVSVSFGDTNVSITATCDCTQTEACDRAYKVARLAAVFADAN